MCEGISFSLNSARAGATIASRYDPKEGPCAESCCSCSSRRPWRAGLAPPRGNLPASPHIWEVTRICIDRSYNSDVRTRIVPELFCAGQEYCSANDITHVVGVTRPHLIKHFIRNGITWLGSEDLIEGEIERAFMVPLKHMRPEYHCRKFAIRSPVLTLAPKVTRRIAA